MQLPVHAEAVSSTACPLHSTCFTCRRRPSVSAPPQVKLRGFRIELGEVEAALADMEGVALAAAAVLKDPSGTPRLVAYYAPDTASEPLLMAGLRGRLPAHMVPTQLVGLARMPLLPNEKINRRALPAPEWGSPVDEEYVAPASELEAQIQAIWQEVLGQERVSTRAGFFAVGGNSLQVGAHLWHAAGASAVGAAGCKHVKVIHHAWR